MSSLVGKGFVVALSLGQDHIRGVEHPARLPGQHLIDRAGNGGAVGDNLRQPVDSGINRVLRCDVVEYDVSPDQHIHVKPGEALCQLFQKELVQHDLAAVVRNEQEGLRFGAFFQEGKICPMVCLSHLGIFKEPQESLCTYILHGAEIDIVADARKQNRRGKGVFCGLNPLAHRVLH